MPLIKYRGLNVRTPKGTRSLSAQAKNKIHMLESEKRGRLASSDKCVIFFPAGAGAVQRCEGRKLRAHNRKQCRKGGKGPQRKLFVVCR